MDFFERCFVCEKKHDPQTKMAWCMEFGDLDIVCEMDDCMLFSLRVVKEGKKPQFWEIYEEVLPLLVTNPIRTIQAIKIFRERTGHSLLYSKSVIEGLRDGIEVNRITYSYSMHDPEGVMEVAVQKAELRKLLDSMPCFQRHDQQVKIDLVESIYQLIESEIPF